MLDKIKKLEEHNLGHEMEIKELLAKIWNLENVPKQDMAMQTWIVVKEFKM